MDTLYYWELYALAGYQSFVGKEIAMNRSDVAIELEYEHCASNGEEETMRGSFTPWMFVNISVINEDQYKKLLCAQVHYSFDPANMTLHQVK